jgi:hypothetical protein
MLKQQLALRLNTKMEAEAEAVWRGLPPRARQQVVQRQARLIGRTAKPVVSPNEREANHGEIEPSR